MALKAANDEYLHWGDEPTYWQINIIYHGYYVKQYWNDIEKSKVALW